MASQDVAARLEAMGVILPPCPEPLGAYVPALRVGDMIHTSGMLPLVAGSLTHRGPVGGAQTVQQGAEAARICAINALAAVAALLGGVRGLSRITRVVQVSGHVLSAPDFADQPAVLNGASLFLAEALGEAGRHTRMALGSAALPLNATVELAMVVQVRP